MNEISKYGGRVKLAQIIHALRAHGALAKANKNPAEFFEQFGIPLPKNIEYEIHLNNDEVEYFILPIDAARQLSEENLKSIIAASDHELTPPVAHSLTTFSSLLSMSTVQCAFCTSCGISCTGSTSTLSTVGTFSSASTGACNPP